MVAELRLWISSDTFRPRAAAGRSIAPARFSRPVALTNLVLE
jgi:hypothetical protein